MIRGHRNRPSMPHTSASFGRRRAGSLVALSIATGAAVGLALSMSGSDFPVVAGALLVLGSAFVVFAFWMAHPARASHDAHRAAVTVALGSVVVLIGLNGLRVENLLSWGDVALLAAVPVGIALAGRRLRDYAPVFWWTAVPVGLLVAVGGAALIFRGGDLGETGLAIAQISLAIAVVPLVLGTLVAASPRGGAILAVALAISVGINATIALFDASSHGTLGSEIAGTQAYAGRFAGLTTHPNLLGLVGAMAFPVMVSAALAWPRPSMRVILVVASFACLAAVIASGSRAALLALPAAGLGLLVAHYYAGNRRRAMSVAALVVVLMTVGAGVILQANPDLALGFNRLTGTVSVGVSDQERAAAYSDAIGAFASSPIVGVGLPALRSASVYLQVVASAGLLGALAFGLAIGGTAVTLLRAGRLFGRVDPKMAALAAGSFGSLMAWLVYGAGQNAITDRFLFLPGAIAVACVLRLRVLRLHIDEPTTAVDAPLSPGRLS